jgi:hypothetical protein
MSEELAGEDAFDLSPVNDVGGQCSTTLALYFDSPESTRSFIEKLSEREIGASTPIDSGRHVYENWDPIMEKHGAHHPGYDAFNLTDSPPEYTPDMCPNTLTILKRTVYIATDPSREPDETMDLVNEIKHAGRTLVS